MSDTGMTEFFGGMAEAIREQSSKMDWRRKTLSSLEKVLKLEPELQKILQEKEADINAYAEWKLAHCPHMRGNFAATISWFNDVANRDPRKNHRDYLFKVLVARKLFLDLTGLHLRSLRARIVDMIDAGEVLWRQ